jgi:nitrate reductase gamma subunit
MGEALLRAPDKKLPWADLAKTTVSWLAPVFALWRKRPVYSAVSFLFHAGLILVPLLLSAHILLWERGAGIRWPGLPQAAADVLTVATIAAALGLFFGRVLHRGARALSRRQDYAWPLILLTPFATGFICVNVSIPPAWYDRMMLIHVYSANLILMMIPFTKIAHCVLLPLCRFAGGLAWKFPVGGGERIAATLGYGDRPTWVERPRLATDRIAVPTEEV